MAKSIFRSAITNDDGEVDVGYLALAWGLVGWLLNNVVILGIAAWAVDKTNGAALIQNAGVALGANAGGFATMLGAVGLFRMGDKERAPVVGVTTKTAESKEVTEVAAAKIEPAKRGKK